VRLTRQIDYVRGSVSPRSSTRRSSTRRRARVRQHRSVRRGGLTKAAIDLLGDQAFMFASDYPHPETIFPDHADTVIGWRKVLGEEATRKLMWENASRFLRLTSTPWSAT
jgi:predicted TIM-barrel fold metal-dependent hydrolase